MPFGIERFAETFAAHTDKYVLIGGTACELALTEASLEFRATKDLDIVLTVASLDPAFSELFWRFVKDGNYRHLRAGGEKTQCYRFDKPTTKDYPFMLELFARKSDCLTPPADRVIGRVTAADDEASSLSAILMDDAYYSLVDQGRRVVKNLSCLKPESIIPLKARAYLDLSQRKASGDKNVKSDDIKKHKNDVMRLSVLLAETDRISLPDPVRSDFGGFLGAMTSDAPDLKQLGLGEVSLETVLRRLASNYGVA